MQKRIWIIILILIGLGFMPYKIPYDPDKLADNELHVKHEESTCSTDLYLVCGELIIPREFKSWFSTTPTELSLDSGSSTMFDPINDNQGNWHLISENEFIISGKVVGVDSSYLRDCGTYIPKFRIDKWSPTRYHANFWSFSRLAFAVYFLGLFTLLLVSLIFIFIRRSWKQKK